MTRTKRWGLLAASLAIAGGTGYGGYTQRHLIFGETNATAEAGETDASESHGDDAVVPIRVSPGDGQSESPAGLENPLRRDLGEPRVVRGNDAGDVPETGNRFEPPPIHPAPSRFGGSAVARVEVAEDGGVPPLAPPPTFPGAPPAASEPLDGEASTYAPTRFASPQSDFTPAPTAGGSAAPAAGSSTASTAGGSTAPANRFGGSGFGTESGSRGDATEPASPLPSVPPNRFGAPPENDQPIASSANDPSALPTPDQFGGRGSTAEEPIGTGIDAARFQDTSPLPHRGHAQGFAADATRFQNTSPMPLGVGTGQPAMPEIEGAGQPGARELDGTQAPSIAVEKFAPPEIQIGKPAKFEIKVKNLGQATAENVVITDQVPQGTRLIDTTPQAASTAGGSVVWQLGTLRAGEEKVVSMQLMPVGEGEIGSVATVTFSAQASVRTKATRPQLLVETTAPRQVLIGQELKLTIRLSNPGTGAATRVVLEEDVPEGLAHAGGRALEFEAGTLKPGETRELELTLSATGAGVVQNVIRARADANLSVESRVAIEVIAPELAINIDGPSKRYLERQATHELIVSNPGTAPAKNVEMVAHLPKGLKYVSANNQGQYDATSHAVFWSLEQLGPRDQGTVALTTVPMEAGQQKIRVESKADMNLAKAQEHVIDVEGLAALFFEVADAADPIEVGGETIYEVRVINQGTKTSTNVRVAAALPASLKPLEAGGATSGVITGQQIVFEALPRLAPKADALFRIRVQGLAKGNQQVRVQLSSDEIPGGVTKEESTRVYADE